MKVLVNVFYILEVIVCGTVSPGDESLRSNMMIVSYWLTQEVGFLAAGALHEFLWGTREVRTGIVTLRFKRDDPILVVD
jgi:hypothetical protein